MSFSLFKHTLCPFSPLLLWLSNAQSSMAKDLKAKPPSFTATKHHHHHDSESPSLLNLYSHHLSLSLSLSLLARAQPWGLNPWPPLLAMVHNGRATTGGHRSFSFPSLFFFLIFFWFNLKAPFFLFFGFEDWGFLSLRV